MLELNDLVDTSHLTSKSVDIKRQDNKFYTAE